MSNTELFAGFNDVMQHIRNQEQKIKDLKSENIKLKTEVHTMKDEYNEIKELYADRDRVKKLNEELNTQIKDVRKQIEDTEKLNTKLNDENKVCRKEVDSIKDAIENECEASGIMEVMNTRIENAENKAREQELLKVIAETDLKKEQKKCNKFINDYMKLRSVLYNQCDLDECSNCGSWVNENEMEEVKDNDWEDGNVCFVCRDNDFTECECCREYVDNRNVVYNEQTQQEICCNCISDDED